MSDEAKIKEVFIQAYCKGVTKSRAANALRRAMTRADDGTTNQTDPFEQLYGHGTKQPIQPRYSQEAIASIADGSGPIATCNEAFASNVVGQGHIVECMDTSDMEPERIAEIAREIDEWLSALPDDGSFGELRKKVYTDFLNGNGYIEVIRSADGEIATLSHIPANTMRICGRSPDATDGIRYNVRGNQWVASTKPVRRRLFIQEVGAVRVYFKEFGDKRIINSKNGDVMPEGSNPETPAHEVIWLRHYSTQDEYGEPIWGAWLPDALGHRKASEVNYNGFEANMVPRMFLIAEGGGWRQEDLAVITEAIESHAGADNSYAPVFLQLPPTLQTGPAGETITSQPKIRIEQMDKIVQDDGMFLQYLADAETNIRTAYRLPEVLVGRSKELTYGSLKASIETAETQVFQAARQEDDFRWNQLLADIATKSRPEWARFKIVSKKAQVADVDAIAALVREGKDSLSINDVRKVMGEALSVSLPAIEDGWALLPSSILGKLQGAGTVSVQDDGSVALTEGVVNALAGIPGTPSTDEEREAAAMILVRARELANEKLEG